MQINNLMMGSKIIRVNFTHSRVDINLSGPLFHLPQYPHQKLEGRFHNRVSTKHPLKLSIPIHVLNLLKILFDLIRQIDIILGLF